MKYKPHTYQLTAINHILTHNHAALFLDLGLGKTVITLTALTALINTHATRRALVVAPLRVAHTTWPNELAKWDHTKNLPYTLITGTAKQRATLADTDTPIHIINRENIPWLHQHHGTSWPYDTLIIDELSSFKNPTAQRVKALRKHHHTRTIGLTGTPAPNGLEDLFAQFLILDEGQRLGTSITTYRNQYFTGEKFINGHFVSYRPKPGAEDQIYTKISDMTLSMKTSDHLTLPALTTVTHDVYLSHETRIVYEDLKRDMVTDLAGETIDAMNAAVLSNKLLQLASGALYTNQPGIVIPVHDAKLDALDDVIESANGHPVLIAYWFKHERDRIRSRYPYARCISTGADIKDWNAGKIPVALIHPASAGHGLNLQQGGHVLVWFTTPWSLELYQQTNARLYRQGQIQPVSIIHLCAKGTIDEQILAAVNRKALTQSALIEAVKTELLEGENQ